MKLKLKVEMKAIGLAVDEVGYGIETGTDKGLAYTVTFPANEHHGNVTLLFMKAVKGDSSTNIDIDKYELIDGSSAGEDVFYNPEQAQ